MARIEAKQLGHVELVALLLSAQANIADKFETVDYRDALREELFERLNELDRLRRMFADVRVIIKEIRETFNEIEKYS